MTYHQLQRRVFAVLEVADFRDTTSKVVDSFLLMLIFFNVIVVILETVESLAAQYADLFAGFELFSVVVFSLEYILRVWSCPVHPQLRHPFWGRVRFMLTPLAIIDLLAILPFYGLILGLVDLRFIRVLRLLRILRLFKAGRYLDALITIGRVLKAKREDLVISLFVVMLLLVMAASAMYVIENEAQPEAFPSIPEAMWWGVATLTTVGYGDVYPVTPLGKLLGGCISILGIGLFALPTSILASGFTEEIEKKRQIRQGFPCPHCGQDVYHPPKT